MRTTKNRIAIYARVSTDDQSADAQLRDLREYASNRGWEGVAEYVDEGISGSKDSRPAWNRLWDEIQKGRVNVLLVHALDRLGRSLPHLVRILSTCVERDITLVSFRENIDLSTSTGRMIAGIFSVLADYELSIVRERTKAGMRSAKLSVTTLLISVLRILLVVIKISRVSLNQTRLPDDHDKRSLIRAIDRSRSALPLRSVLRIIRLSPSRSGPYGNHIFQFHDRILVADTQTPMAIPEHIGHGRGRREAGGVLCEGAQFATTTLSILWADAG